MGVLFKVEIRDILEVQGVKSQGGESETVKGEIFEVKKWGEYTSLEFKEYLVSEGIKHQRTISGRPEQMEQQSAWIGHLQNVFVVSSYMLTCQKDFV